MRIRNAKPSDSKAILELVGRFAGRNIMLPLTEDYLFEHINNYFVAETGNRVVGTVFLRVYTDNLAEIRSLAVAEEAQGSGIGKQLVKHVAKKARSLGIRKLLSLTLVPSFFSKLGFREDEITQFPEKIWTDCDICTKKDNCDETTMILDLDG